MKTNPEWRKPKSKSSSRGGIPAKKIEIVAVAQEENERFDTLCGDLHYLGATRPVGHFLRQAAVVGGEWIALLAPIQAAFPEKPPVYGSPEKGHGRIEQRAVLVLPTNALESSFPHARSIIAVHSKGIRDGKPYGNVRHYISSLEPGHHTAVGWGRLIRGHWGGVENRNHWRKDAVWLEDHTRSRKPKLVGNLALIRNTLLKIFSDHREQYGSLPAFTEALGADESEAYRLIMSAL